MNTQYSVEETYVAVYPEDTGELKAIRQRLCGRMPRLIPIEDSGFPALLHVPREPDEHRLPVYPEEEPSVCEFELQTLTVRDNCVLLHYQVATIETALRISVVMNLLRVHCKGYPLRTVWVPVARLPEGEKLSEADRDALLEALPEERTRIRLDMRKIFLTRWKKAFFWDLVAK